MKRIIALAFVVAAVAVPARGQTRSAAERDVIRASQLLDEASLIKKDRATLERYYADDYVYTHSNGAVLNKTQEIASIMSDTGWTAQKTDDRKARIFGNVAIVTGLLTLTGSSKTYVPGPRRFTEVWVKRNGRWQMVGGQTTLVPAK
jgi:ketosteroid isomerase-like protein